MNFFRPCFFASLAGLTSLIRAAEFPASNAAEVADASAKAQPGDTIVLSEGEWKDQPVVFKAKGSTDQPIVLKSQTAGKTVFTGTSSFSIDGEYLVVSGLLFKDAGKQGDGIVLRGNHNRLTETAMVGGGYRLFVHLAGVEHRVDHCYFVGKTSPDPTVQVEVGNQPNHHRIEYNHFGSRPSLNKGSSETVRVGTVAQSMNSSRTMVQFNLFDHCDAGTDIIGNEASETIIRRNTFLECAGLVALRHGSKSTVQGNFFFAHHKKGSAGIRVGGEDDVIINNYIEGADRGGIWIGAGIPDAPQGQYVQAKNCIVVYNTILDSTGPCIDLDWGLGESKRTLPPQGITIANNLLSAPKGGFLFKGDQGPGYRWAGNLAAAAVSVTPRPGVEMVDLKLKLAADGLWRPGEDSPVRGAGEGTFTEVRKDIDGQVRQGKFDVGCDQISDAPITYRPLQATDVGPSWMDRSKL